jgi:hypothetical protein
MKKLILILLVLLMAGASYGASLSKLYLGELDGQLMAGLETKMGLEDLYLGGDIRTTIRQVAVMSKGAVLGFFPDRTDYTVFIGIPLFGAVVEYSHTCSHTVISSQNTELYMNPMFYDNVDKLTVQVRF